MVSDAMSIRFARCQRVVLPCAVRRPRSLLDFAATRNSREAPQTLALSRADRGRRRHRFDDHPRDLQLATEIAHCVARAPACKNYVEVRLTALGSEPRNSSISASECSSPAHSCDLCTGVYAELSIATLTGHPLSRTRRPTAAGRDPHAGGCRSPAAKGTHRQPPHRGLSAAKTCALKTSPFGLCSSSQSSSSVSGVRAAVKARMAASVSE